MAIFVMKRKKNLDLFQCFDRCDIVFSISHIDCLFLCRILSLVTYWQKCNNQCFIRCDVVLSVSGVCVCVCVQNSEFSIQWAGMQ